MDHHPRSGLAPRAAPRHCRDAGTTALGKSALPTSDRAPADPTSRGRSSESPYDRGRLKLPLDPHGVGVPTAWLDGEVPGCDPGCRPLMDSPRVRVVHGWPPLKRVSRLVLVCSKPNSRLRVRLPHLPLAYLGLGLRHGDQLFESRALTRTLGHESGGRSSRPRYHEPPLPRKGW